MVEPWRVSFPVLVDPWSKVEHIVYLCRHIPDARGPQYPPTMGYAIGMGRDGVVRKFTIPLDEYYKAEKLSLVHMLQVDNIQAKSGSIVDATGIALGKEPELKQ
jgi:hypothetical protein